MTSQSPRIYTYKITFEEVPYYYYGVHKEKRYNEYYMGSPVTHKWCWEFYTLKKQILEIFPYTDEGWLEAQEVETRLIKPFFNNDKWCLNESCGGFISLDILRKTGKRMGNKSYEEGTGIFSLSKKELIENGKKNYKQKKGIHALTKEERVNNAKIGGKTSGQKSYELRLGIHSLPKEETIKNAINGGIKSKELGVGIHSLTKEEGVNNGKVGGKIGGIKSKELGVGIHALTKEERVECGRQKYEQGIGIHARTREEMSEHSKRVVKITNSQKWQCTVTGYVSTPGPLTCYQKARGIDTTNRVRIE